MSNHAARKSAHNAFCQGFGLETGIHGRKLDVQTNHTGACLQIGASSTIHTHTLVVIAIRSGAAA